MFDQGLHYLPRHKRVNYKLKQKKAVGRCHLLPGIKKETTIYFVADTPVLAC